MQTARQIRNRPETDSNAAGDMLKGIKSRVTAKRMLVKAPLAGLFLMGAITTYAEPAQEARQDEEKDKPRLVVQTGHGGDIQTLALSQDDRLIASGGADNSIILWDARSGRQLRRLTGHVGPITSLAFSPDGQALVSIADGSGMGEKDGVRLWDISTGRQLYVLRSIESWGESECTGGAVSFSPDGRIFAAACFGKIHLWATGSGKKVGVLETDRNERINFLSFSPDGKLLATSSEGSGASLWDISAGKRVSHQGAMDTRGVAFTSTDQAIAVGHVNGIVSIIGIDGAPAAVTIKHDGTLIKSLSLSADGQLVAICDLSTGLSLWTTAAKKLWGEQEAYTFKSCYGAAFSADGKTLAVIGEKGAIRVVDLSKSADWRGAGAGRNDSALPPRLDEHSARGLAKSIRAATLSPDGKALASGSRDGYAHLWRMIDGVQENNLSINAGYGYVVPILSSLAYSPDGKWLAIARKSVSLHNLESGGEQSLGGGKDFSLSDFFWGVAFSGDSSKILYLHSDPSARNPASKLSAWDILQDRSLFSVTLDSVGQNFALAPDGRLAAVASSKKPFVVILDQQTGGELSGLNVHTLPPLPDISTAGSEKHEIAMDEYRAALPLGPHWNLVRALAFSPDSRLLATGSADTTIKIWDATSREILRTLGEHFSLEKKAGHDGEVLSVAFAPSGNLLASGSTDRTVRVWDVVNGKELRILRGHDGPVNSVSFSSDAKLLLSGGEDGSTKLWRVSDGKLLASLFSFTDGSWVVTDPEGRFDTSGLEEIKGLHWVMPDDPLTPVPLEAFMKEYYEPRLLARILNGEQFKPVPKLMDKNRVQPEVRIVGVTQDAKDAEHVNVTVEVAGNQKDYLRSGKPVPMKTAAHDLHLFRDGQLVGYIDGKILEQGAKPIRKTFSVRVPSYKADQDITFSAYAFNDDRVKSNTVRASYHAPATLQAHKGHVYVISMGVNRHDNPAWNLKFAANDARLVQKSVTDKLGKTGKYQDIVSISLISDDTDQHAVKGALRGILAKLSGKQPDKTDTEQLKGIPNSDKLQTATPDDLILLTFSGHGFADDSGNFYLINQDTGTGQGKVITDTLKARSISSSELSNWLRGVDAGDMTMIVDACQSAASVQGDGFKPGPMGSRGLGQLSFDKGMRILAASQADEYALENDQLKQGLLSFSLVTDGLDAFNADREPRDSRIMLDEWLRYGVDRVPQLAEEIKTGHVHVANRGSDARSAVRVSATAGGKSRPAQQPALFDFAKKRRQVEVAAER